MEQDGRNKEMGDGSPRVSFLLKKRRQKIPPSHRLRPADLLASERHDQAGRADLPEQSARQHVIATMAVAVVSFIPGPCFSAFSQALFRHDD